MNYYIGIDIGGTKCAVVIAEEKNSDIIDKVSFATQSDRGCKAVIDDITESLFLLLKRNKIDSNKVLCCGVSCGGPLDSEKGVIMNPPNLPGWDNIPFTDIITGKFGFPCKLSNDADACALAEWQFGAGRGSDNMVFLTFGTGMGAGLILNGKLYSGKNGLAGEVGHVRLAQNGTYGYGKFGSFEGYCSGGGIERTARNMLSDYNGSTCLSPEHLTAKDIADAAKTGDEFAVSVYNKCGEMLGRGIAVLIDILAPEKIIIGSIYYRSRELLVESMKKTLKEEALADSLEKCEILPCELGDRIGDYAAIGVARSYINEIIGENR